jgi:hypothetical protein
MTLSNSNARILRPDATEGAGKEAQQELLKMPFHIKW